MVEYGFSENKDFSTFLSESRGGRPAKEYLLSIGMAKEIAMIQRTERGKQIRQYFIDVENEYRNSIVQSQPSLRLPENNMEMLQVIQVTDAKANKRIDALSNEFSDLKESFGLPNDMRKRFTKARNKRVVEVMGGYHGTAYANKKVRSAVYRQLSNFLKERYVIDEYASLPMSKFEEAMRLTANWEPDEILSLAIDGANEQPLLNA